MTLVSIQKWPFFTISALICGVSCAAYSMSASAQLLDFLDLVKNCAFLNWKLTRVRISFMDGHYLIYATIPYGGEIITRMYSTTMIISFTILSGPEKWKSVLKIWRLSKHLLNRKRHRAAEKRE